MLVKNYNSVLKCFSDAPLAFKSEYTVMSSLATVIILKNMSTIKYLTNKEIKYLQRNTHTNVVYVEIIDILCSHDPACYVVRSTVRLVIRLPPFTTEPSWISP